MNAKLIRKGIPSGSKMKRQKEFPSGSPGTQVVLRGLSIPGPRGLGSNSLRWEPQQDPCVKQHPGRALVLGKSAQEEVYSLGQDLVR